MEALQADTSCLSCMPVRRQDDVSDPPLVHAVIAAAELRMPAAGHQRALSEEDRSRVRSNTSMAASSCCCSFGRRHKLDGQLCQDLDRWRRGILGRQEVVH